LSEIESLLPGLPWLGPFLALARLAPRRSLDIQNLPLGNTTPVSVIIPARNESETIDTLLHSVSMSRYPSLEVIVVDDRSTDDTAARVRAWSERDSRIRLLNGAELPDGWLGKPWACHQGAQEATGDVLIFTDADTSHHPDLIDHTVSAVRDENADLLTLTSRQLCVSFWERLVMPQIWVLLGLRYPPARINRARRPHQVVANGQFIATPRSSYQRLGGHEGVRAEVVEDLALAQRWFRAGATIRMLQGESRISTRMYRSLAEMTEGWSKNLHVGARQSLSGLPLLPHFATLAVLGVFAFWLVPFVLLALGVATTAMIVAIGLSLAFWSLAMWAMRIPAIYSLGYPVGAAMAAWITLRSMLRGARRIEWRGRTYDLSRKQ
jgi:chlorobactene glucosyltransferase